MIDDTIAKFESAEAGSRELDYAFAAVLVGGYVEKTMRGSRVEYVVWGEDRGIKKAPISGHEYQDRDLAFTEQTCPHYTANLQHVMGAVPEDAWLTLDHRRIDGRKVCSARMDFDHEPFCVAAIAATFELALCLARLKYELAHKTMGETG